MLGVVASHGVAEDECSLHALAAMHPASWPDCSGCPAFEFGPASGTLDASRSEDTTPACDSDPLHASELAAYIDAAAAALAPTLAASPSPPLSPPSQRRSTQCLGDEAEKVARRRERRRLEQRRYRQRGSRASREFAAVTAELAAARAEAAELRTREHSLRQMLAHQVDVMGVASTGTPRSGLLQTAAACRPASPISLALVNDGDDCVDIRLVELLFPVAEHAPSAPPPALYQSAIGMARSLASDAVWAAGHVPPESLVKFVVMLAPEEELLARESSFMAFLHSDVELWRRDASAQPGVEARLRAAFEREHMVASALAECRPTLMQSMIGARLAPLQAGSMLHGGLQLLVDELNCVLTDSQRRLMRDAWQQYSVQAAGCRHAALAELQALHDMAACTLVPAQLLAEDSVTNHLASGQTRMEAIGCLQARLAEIDVRSHQRLAAAASLWRGLESALEVSQRAALRLACWPLLPDPIQLAQSLT